MTNDIIITVKRSGIDRTLAFRPLYEETTLDFMKNKYFYVFVCAYIILYCSAISFVNINYEIYVGLTILAFILCMLIFVILFEKCDYYLVLELVKKFEWMYLVFYVFLFHGVELYEELYKYRETCFLNQWVVSDSTCLTVLIINEFCVRTIAILISVLFVSVDSFPYLRIKYKKIIVLSLILIYSLPVFQYCVGSYRELSLQICIIYCIDAVKYKLSICINLLIIFFKLLYNIILNPDKCVLLNVPLECIAFEHGEMINTRSSIVIPTQEK